MKRIITFIAAFAFSTVVAAEIKNINQSPRASVMTGLAVAVGEAIEGGTDFYQSRDCRDAANVYKNSDNAVMAYETMLVAAAKEKGLDCAVDFKPEEVAVYTWATYSLCRLNDTTTPLQDATEFGMSGMHPYKAWVKEFNTKNYANLQVKLYGGSGATMKGLLAKEIEWGFIATAVARKAANARLVICDFITDPTQKNFVGNFFNHELADIRIKVAILAKGKGSDNVKKDLASEEFNAYLTKYGYTFITTEFDNKSKFIWDEEYKILERFYK